MRTPITILALGAALVSAPALAQINVGVGGNAGGGLGVGLGSPGGISVGGSGNVGVGGNVGVNPGGTIGGVTGTLDNTVSRVDRVTNRTVDRLEGDLRVATRADLTAGATVRDRNGRKVGTVHSVHGDMAVIVRGGRTMHVPIARLYRGASGLVTRLTDAELRAAASAHANAGGSVRN